MTSRRGQCAGASRVRAEEAAVARMRVEYPPEAARAALAAVGS